MDPVTTSIEFFSESELSCNGTGIIKLDPRFAVALPELRRAWGGALSVSSICRTPAYNRKVGGKPNSLHLTENPKWPTFGTMAADIPWRDWPTEKQLKFARLAWSLGWAVGLHAGFVHVDRRKDLCLSRLPQTVFLYGSSWVGAFGRDEIVSV